MQQVSGNLPKRKKNDRQDLSAHYRCANLSRQGGRGQVRCWVYCEHTKQPISVGQTRHMDPRGHFWEVWEGVYQRGLQPL